MRPNIESVEALVSWLPISDNRVAAIDQAALVRFGPREFFSGVEANLAEFCIPGIKRP